MKRTLSIAAILAGVLILIGFLAIRGDDDASARTQAATKASDPLASDEARRIRHAIQNDPVAPTVAPAGHDVTIVFFTDYQCPYCRRMHATLERLMRETDGYGWSIATGRYWARPARRPPARQLPPNTKASTPGSTQRS